MPGPTLVRLQCCKVFFPQMILTVACVMETNEELLALWIVRRSFSSENCRFS